MSKSPPKPRKGPLASALALILAVLAAVLVPLLTGGPEPSRPPATSPPATTVTGVAKTSGGNLTTVTAPVPAVAAAASGAEDVDTRTDTPPGVSLGDLAKARADQNVQAKIDALPVHPPDAAPEQTGCISRFHLGSHSSRLGLAPQAGILHETVSRNVAGTADVNGIWNYFNNPATQASATYIVDREGHCIYAVREVDKPWTQAGANRFSIGIEVVNSATTTYDRNYIDGAGLRKLALIVHDSSHRWGIPLRVGSVVNCAVKVKGWLTHKMLGACGGGHSDIGPFDAGLGQVLEAARRIDTVCSSLKYHRTKGQARLPKGAARDAQIRQVTALKKTARAILLNPSKAACLA